MQEDSPLAQVEGRSPLECTLEYYISSLGFVVEHSNRTVLDGYEIDLFVPSLSIGFEINGLTYHSTSCNKFPLLYPKAPDYHLKKTLVALSHGVLLYHLWSFTPLPELKSLIRDILNGDQVLSNWVDLNPQLAPQSVLKPLYYVAPNPLIETGLVYSKPRSWDDKEVLMFEFYNSGFVL